MPIEVTMPALSPTMEEGNLAKWTKKEGDSVSAGEVIAEIETDKATMEVEAVDEGTLGKIIVDEGTKNVKVNSVIALLLEEGEDKSALKDYKISEPANDSSDDDSSEDEEDESKEKEDKSSKKEEKQQSSTPSATPTVAPKPSKAPTPVKAPSSNTDVKASPVAKKLAEEYGIDLSNVPGTGPKGRVTKQDVEDFVSKGGAGFAKRASVDFTTHENSNIRQVIAKRLLEAKQQIPHFYLTVDCNITSLLETRKQVNNSAPKDKEGQAAYKISVNDLVIKAVALALKEVPAANASWYDDAIVQYNNVDVSVAVATDSGLITPIVFNADQKSVIQISAEVKELAKLARENALKPEQFQGGGFSVSNLGMYGIKDFSAIINPPQSCILAVGAGEQRAIVNDGELEIADVMTVTLSVDHRSVDGAVGATFLQSFKKFIENPAGLLV